MKSKSSIVKFISEDKICTTVSVQRMSCPVFDLKHTIDFNGQYQTMTQLASISVDNTSPTTLSSADTTTTNHDSTMYIVVSVHPSDKDCCDSANCSEANYHRIKKLTININAGYDHSKINLNFAITLSVFLAIYLFICPFLCFVEPYSEKNFKFLIDEFRNNSVNSLTTNTPITSSQRSMQSISRIENKQQQQKLTTLISNNNNNNNKDKQLTVDLLTNKHDNNSLDIGLATDLVVEKIDNHISHDNTLVTEDNSFSSNEFDKLEDAETYKETVRNKVILIFLIKNITFCILIHFFVCLIKKAKFKA